MGRKYKNQRRKNQKKEEDPELVKKVKEEKPYHSHITTHKRNIFFETFYKVI